MPIEEESLEGYDIITCGDAQLMRIRFPETFEAPTEEDIEEITAEYYVKVSIAGDDEAGYHRERVWVRVTEVVTNQIDAFDTIFRGILANESILKPEEFPLGRRVEFRGRHIYSFMTPAEAVPPLAAPQAAGVA
jgi:hypothetical protein